MMKKKPTILIILDGFGYSTNKISNASFLASTPNLDLWKTKHSYKNIQAAGSAVGLPNKQNGNSEVGHFTIGSGKIVPQTSLILNSKMNYNSLISNQILMKELKKFKPNKTVHVIGLTSNGNVHSNIEHLYAILDTLQFYNIKNIAVHAFLDGRDTPPISAIPFLNSVQNKLKNFENGNIATIHGRYYAMDRDNNQERTNQSFHVLTQAQTQTTSYEKYLQAQYKQQETDEFITPQACIKNHTIQDGDGIIFFNFRPDRARQITSKLLTLNTSFFITPILYDEHLKTTPLVNATQTSNTLLEKLNNKKKTIHTITETEKFNHLTYFFNGHRNINFSHETRTLIPSLTVKNYSSAPEMKAEEITQTVLKSLEHTQTNFYLINFANADMVGHTGNLPATIKAIEIIDSCLQKIYEKAFIEQDGTIYITADHGNAEKMFDSTSNQPCTSHTNNLVPFYAINKKKEDLTQLQGLSDIASHILKNMNL